MGDLEACRRLFKECESHMKCDRVQHTFLVEAAMQVGVHSLVCRPCHAIKPAKAPLKLTVCGVVHCRPGRCAAGPSSFWTRLCSCLGRLGGWDSGETNACSSRREPLGLAPYRQPAKITCTAGTRQNSCGCLVPC